MRIVRKKVLSERDGNFFVQIFIQLFRGHAVRKKVLSERDGNLNY